MRILFWFGIALAADALVGLCGLNHWRKIVPAGLDIGRIAVIEAMAALVLLSLYFVLRLI